MVHIRKFEIYVFQPAFCIETLHAHNAIFNQLKNMNAVAAMHRQKRCKGIILIHVI